MATNSKIIPGLLTAAAVAAASPSHAAPTLAGPTLAGPSTAAAQAPKAEGKYAQIKTDPGPGQDLTCTLGPDGKLVGMEFTQKTGEKKTGITTSGVAVTGTDLEAPNGNSQFTGSTTFAPGKKSDQAGTSVTVQGVGRPGKYKDLVVTGFASTDPAQQSVTTEIEKTYRSTMGNMKAYCVIGKGVYKKEDADRAAKAADPKSGGTLGISGFLNKAGDGIQERTGIKGPDGNAYRRSNISADEFKAKQEQSFPPTQPISDKALIPGSEVPAAKAAPAGRKGNTTQQQRGGKRRTASPSPAG